MDTLQPKPPASTSLDVTMNITCLACCLWDLDKHHRPLPPPSSSSLGRGWKQTLWLLWGAAWQGVSMPTQEQLCVASRWPVAFDKATQGKALSGNRPGERSVYWPLAVLWWQVMAPPSSPLQKHNLNNGFHVKFWSEPRFGKLQAFKMWLSSCFEWSPLTNPKPSYQSTKIYWALTIFHFTATKLF